MANPKETGFFDDDELYELGLHYYARQFFAGARPDSLTADATPSYFAGDEVVIARIRQFYAGVRPKFLLLVRDPVDRTWSHYLHLRRLMVEERSFVNAVADDMASEFSQQRYLRHGMYGMNMERWTNDFAKPEDFLVITIEELRNSPTAMARRIDEFLGIEIRSWEYSPLVLNEATMPRYPMLMRRLNQDSFLRRMVQRSMPAVARRRLITRIQDAMLRPPHRVQLPNLEDSMRQELARHFRPDLCLFSSITGQDVGHWSSQNNIHGSSAVAGSEGSIEP